MRFFFLVFMSVILSRSVSNGQVFKTMTLNIRLDVKSDSLDNWHLRKKEIVQFFKNKDPKIIGLQEALFHQLHYLDSSLVHYVSVGEGRDGQQKGEFSAILIDTTFFKILESGTFWLSETPAQPSKGWDAAYPRICTFAKLKISKNGRQLWVFNTHLDHMGQKARIESVKLILQNINSLNAEHLPHLFFGDLNATPDEKPIQMLMNVYKDNLPKKIKGAKGTFNDFGKLKNMPRIDYIFGDQVKLKKYTHLKDKRKNGRYLSDHLAVMAKIEFLKTE